MMPKKNNFLGKFNEFRKSLNPHVVQKGSDVADGRTLPTNQPMTITEEEVCERFEIFLNELNLNEEKKAPLRNKSVADKKKLLEIHAQNSKQVPTTPKEFIESLQSCSLKGEKRLKVLESLRVSLSSNPVSWAAEFGLEGLNGILKNLTYCCDNKQEKRSTYECVRCLKAFMNNHDGLEMIITHEEALTILARTMDPSDPITMLEAVRLLAAICLVLPHGHEKALEGITSCAEIRGKGRFDTIIKGLEMEDNYQMQVACIQLVNAIVSTPDNAEFRIHLRNEFIRNGLNDILEKLAKLGFIELQTQLTVFHEHMEEDSWDLLQRYDNVKAELSSPDICYKLLINSVLNTPSLTYFLSILQHLLLIREEPYAKVQYYKLIEECVSQIVIQKKWT